MDQPPPASTDAPGIVRFGRALLLHCPACGSGGIFKSWFKLEDRCPRCGFVYQRGEHGYQIGSMALDLVVPLVIWFFSFFGLLYATWPNPPWFLLQWGSVAFMVGFPILFYPMSHTLAIALDLVVRPPNQRNEGRESPGWRDR